MTQEQKIIRAKVGLLELAKQLGNVSQACKMMGYSRDSFYRFHASLTVVRHITGGSGHPTARDFSVLGAGGSEFSQKRLDTWMAR